MKWFSKNWFKFILTLISLLIGFSVFYYFVIFLPKKEQAQLDIEKSKASLEVYQQQQKEQREQVERDEEAAEAEALEQSKAEAKSNLDNCLADASNSYTLDWLQECKSQNLLSSDCKKFADSSYTSKKYATEHNLSLLDGITKFYEEQDKCNCRLPQYNADINDKRYKEKKDECFKQYSQ